MESIRDTAFKAFASGILVDFDNKFLALLLPLCEFGQELILQIVKFQILLPVRKDLALKILQTEDEGEEDVDLDGVLTHHYLFELVEG